MAHVVQERRRKRSSRELPFGQFPRDFGKSNTPDDGFKGNFKGSNAMAYEHVQRKARAEAADANKIRAAVSASSEMSMFGAGFGDWGTGVDDDVLAGSGVDDSVSTGGPGDFAGVTRAREGSTRDGSEPSNWHWRTG